MEALWRPCGGPGWVPGWGGMPPRGFSVPGRSKTAVSTPADRPCVDCKSRRALSRTVGRLSDLFDRYGFPFGLGFPFGFCFSFGLFCLRSFPFTHWKPYL